MSTMMSMGAAAWARVPAGLDSPGRLWAGRGWRRTEWRCWPGRTGSNRLLRDRVSQTTLWFSLGMCRRPGMEYNFLVSNCWRLCHSCRSERLCGASPHRLDSRKRLQIKKERNTRDRVPQGTQQPLDGAITFPMVVSLRTYHDKVKRLCSNRHLRRSTCKVPHGKSKWSKKQTLWQKDESAPGKASDLQRAATTYTARGGVFRTPAAGTADRQMRDARKSQASGASSQMDPLRLAPPRLRVPPPLDSTGGGAGRRRHVRGNSTQRSLPALKAYPFKTLSQTDGGLGRVSARRSKM